MDFPATRRQPIAKLRRLARTRGPWPVRTWAVCYANGMLGYLPTEDCFKRGGYECTFGPPSLMAPDTGAKLADAAIELIKAK